MDIIRMDTELQKEAPPSTLKTRHTSETQLERIRKTTRPMEMSAAFLIQSYNPVCILNLFNEGQYYDIIM